MFKLKKKHLSLIYQSFLDLESSLKRFLNSLKKYAGLVASLTYLLGARMSLKKLLQQKVP